MTNLAWFEIYAALIKCRKNIQNVFPKEYSTFPINSEPDLTKNHTGIQQDLSKNVTLYQLLDCDGDLKSFENLNLMNGAIKME